MSNQTMQRYRVVVNHPMVVECDAYSPEQAAEITRLNASDPEHNDSAEVRIAGYCATPTIYAVDLMEPEATNDK